MESKKIKVLLDDKENPGKRKEVEVDFIRESVGKVWVRLPNGNIISRRKNRDMVKVA